MVSVAGFTATLPGALLTGIVAANLKAPVAAGGVLFAEHPLTAAAGARAATAMVIKATRRVNLITVCFLTAVPAGVSGRRAGVWGDSDGARQSEPV
jgi:hypothetical protein